LLERAVFTVVIGDADAHGKNVSLLHPTPGRISLAPLYDTVPTALWPSLRPTAAMLVNVAPVLTVLLAGWFLGEGFTGSVLFGLAVAFLGALVVGFATRGTHGVSWQGVALCLIAAVCYALGMVLQKPALRHASSLQVTTFSCLVGALACLPFCGQLLADVRSTPATATANVPYLGVFPTAFGFVTWGYALARTPAAKLGVTTYMVPVIVILLSWAILDEAPSRIAILGGALCLSGVALARRKQNTVSS
jgi:drug/metabolite transporter (DMT)-like permease